VRDTREVADIDRAADPELVAAANRYLHAYGGRDEIRSGQVRTFLRWLGRDPMSHPTLESLRRARIDWTEVAGRPGLLRRDAALWSIDQEFIRWTDERRAAGDEFPNAHVWLRGFVSTALAVEDRRAGRSR
jgi:hypothetical protein